MEEKTTSPGLELQQQISNIGLTTIPGNAMPSYFLMSISVYNYVVQVESPTVQHLQHCEIS